MRFRTQIANISLLHKIIRSLAALARTCVIRLSENQVHFIVPGNENKDGVQVWSQVKVDTLFSNFRVESNNNNEIWLEISLDALLKVLRSADSSVADGIMGADPRNATSLEEGEVSLKLNKRDKQAIWAFDIRGRSQLSHKPMQISHEINVHVLSVKRQGELNEPLCPPPDIHLMLPSLTDLRNIVGRLGHMAEDVKISANHEGRMELSVHSKGVDLITTWENLHIPSQNNPEESEEEPPAKDKMFSAVVPIRAMQKFLTSHLVGGVAIACVCENHCLIAYVYIGEVNEAGGVLTFFIPAKTFGEDDDHKD